MRRLIVILLLVFAGRAVCSQTVDSLAVRSRSGGDSVKVDSANGTNAMRAYFLKYGLNPDSATTRKLYDLVYDWKGTQYKYAGNSKSGVDCSGFACEIYTQCYDTTLPGGCTNIYTMVDTIAKDSLREGDLVFFKIRKGQISHVGVYLGNSYFAHASVHSGVTVSSLNEAYYKKYYFVGGRLGKSGSRSGSQ